MEGVNVKSCATTLSVHMMLCPPIEKVARMTDPSRPASPGPNRTISRISLRGMTET